MKKLYFYGLSLIVHILSAIGLFIVEKLTGARDFIIDCVAQAFTIQKTKSVVVLSVSQAAMRRYYKRFAKFTSIMLYKDGFTHKLAVNASA